MDVPKEAIDIIYALLPGFISAWVFYGLTAHPKSSPFERIVQALIFTVIVKALLIPAEKIALWIGKWHSFGTWDSDVAIVYSVVLALALGLIAARLANNNTIHEFLRENKRYDRLRNRLKKWWLFRWLPQWETTCRTSSPSEWFTTFKNNQRYVVLHMKGDRRLYGWPEQWPDQPDRGQFVIMQPQWWLRNGKIGPLHNTERIMIPAQEVEMVEFLIPEENRTASEEDVLRVQKMMVALQEEPKQGVSDGS